MDENRVDKLIVTSMNPKFQGTWEQGSVDTISVTRSELEIQLFERKKPHAAAPGIDCAGLPYSRHP